MINIPSIRITVPKTAAAMIARHHLLAAFQNSPQKITYIHAGAGYGKTTLLSQIAGGAANAVWLSLDGEDDIFTFVNELCAAVQQTFPAYDFAPSEYLPFAGKDNFISMLAGALICSMENIPQDFILVLDDIHTTENAGIRQLLAGLMKYAPRNARLCLGSREAPWADLLPLKVRGELLELTQKALAFTREEAAAMLGFDDSSLYEAAEGWPLAVGSFKVLLESGMAVGDIPAYGNEALYTYLFRECVGSLNPGLADFLKQSACFDELDPQLLNEVLNIKNARLMLENLAARNIFTAQTGGGFYRYHTLFRNSLLKDGDASGKALLLEKAARYYFERKQYAMAARYAINAGDCGFLANIILACYRDYIKAGSYNELRIWFRVLDDACTAFSPGLLVAKGAYLSTIGNFVEAKACLAAAIPLLDPGDKERYVEAMVHQARVLRNFVSFGESNRLLDELLTKLADPVSELTYNVVMEKLYNLCWDSRVNEALALARHLIEKCATAGNLKVMGWFDRYLSAIYFFAGNMKQSVAHYEKSLALGEEDLKYLGVHSTAIYAAKAYQMLGDRERSLAVITEELRRLRSTGNFEELWSGYLLAAEIHYQNAFIDRSNGGNTSFEAAVKYFSLADEFAPLYRKTEFQRQWAKLQRQTSCLIFTDGPQEDTVREIFESLAAAGAYLKNCILARLMGYFSAIADYPNAVRCAAMCVAAGEEAGMMLHATLAYGILAKAAIEMKDEAKATKLTGRYLKLCADNGIYEYFRMRKAYDPVLAFAYDNGIEPEITRWLMEFASFTPKKVYIDALGGFAAFRDKERLIPLKLRRKKERELLAFLLSAGERGATKEQIYSAIWWESESENVKNLIAVNLTSIKNELGRAGLEKSIVCRKGRYFICREEIECDTDLLAKAYGDFRQNATPAQAKKLLSLYQGEYLAGFEALWAEPLRIRYREIYEEARRLITR
jgi:LuxR family maltose regulon positive regulatory protein